MLFLDYPLSLEELLVNACIYDNLERVKELVEKGANICVYRDVCIAWAKLFNNFEIIKYIDTLS